MAAKSSSSLVASIHRAAEAADTTGKMAQNAIKMAMPAAMVATVMGTPYRA